MVAQPEKLELCLLPTSSEDMSKMTALEEKLRLELKQSVRYMYTILHVYSNILIVFVNRICMSFYSTVIILVVCVYRVLYRSNGRCLNWLVTRTDYVQSALHIASYQLSDVPAIPVSIHALVLVLCTCILYIHVYILVVCSYIVEIHIICDAVVRCMYVSVL